MIWRTLVCGMVLAAAVVADASPRAMAIVAVAVAVDELLQTNRPALPDTLSKRDATTPVETPKPLLSIDERALDSITPRKRISVTIYSPSWHCQPCADMKADAEANEWKDGDTDIAIQWITHDQPPGCTGFPWIVCGNRIFVGKRTRLQLREWVGLPAVQPSAVAQSVGAVTVGTINGAAIRAALAQLQPHGKDSVIKLDAAAVIIPASVAVDVGVSPERIAIRFPKTPRPRLSYGSGWLAVSQPVSSLTLTPGLLTVGLDGFPDLAVRVE